MKNKFTLALLATAVGLVMTTPLQAAVSIEQAAQLGKTLTHIGAESAANADASIPAYSGGLRQAPAGYQNGDAIRPDPFANEQPLLVISKANMAEHQQYLTATTQELLKRFPTFKVHLYPTHRTAAYPDELQANAVKNATQAEAREQGLVLANVLPGVPFPIPQTGAEAMWNSLLRFQGVSFTSKYDSWNVDAAGNATLATTGQAYNSFPIYENMNKVISDKDIFFQTKLMYTGPARRAGEAIMLKDSVNPIKHPRRAWQYLPGVRRVKLAPNLAHDTPNPGTAGSSTFDDVYVFNGAIDRFNWTIVGKQEMYIPYNTYKLTYVQDPAQLTTANHLNPDYVRFEKHRVWVVEGKLKDNARHVYHSRRFYLDEDSWIILASDQYDARGDLYRGSFAFLTQSYDVSIPDATPHMIYDLVTGSYNINGVVGPHGGIRYTGPLPKTQWAPEALAGSGIR